MLAPHLIHFIGGCVVVLICHCAAFIGFRWSVLFLKQATPADAHRTQHIVMCHKCARHHIPFNGVNRLLCLFERCQSHLRVRMVHIPPNLIVRSQFGLSSIPMGTCAGSFADEAEIWAQSARRTAVPKRAPCAHTMSAAPHKITESKNP